MNTDQRILGMTDQTVTYLVKDYRNDGRYIPHTIKEIDFLRMFLMHVLPKGFVRIRHYGLVHTIDFWYMSKIPPHRVQLLIYFLSYTRILQLANSKLKFLNPFFHLSFICHCSQCSFFCSSICSISICKVKISS